MFLASKGQIPKLSRDLKGNEVDWNPKKPSDPRRSQREAHPVNWSNSIYKHTFSSDEEDDKPQRKKLFQDLNLL